MSSSGIVEPNHNKLKQVSKSFNFRRQSNAEFLLQICQKGKKADNLGTPLWNIHDEKSNGA